MSFETLRPELHTLVGLYVGLGVFALRGCSRRLNAGLDAAKTLQRALRPDRIAELETRHPYST